LHRSDNSRAPSLCRASSPRALGPDSVGQTVTLELRRGVETKNVALTIGERPTLVSFNGDPLHPVDVHNVGTYPSTPIREKK